MTITARRLGSFARTPKTNHTSLNADEARRKHQRWIKARYAGDCCGCGSRYCRGKLIYPAPNPHQWWAECCKHQTDTTPTHQHKTGPLPTLLGPNRPKAACKGKGNLWDNYIDGEKPTDRDQRHAQAIAVCATCPELNRCEPLPGDDGIYGGALHGRKQRCNNCNKPLPDNQDYANLHKYCTQTCRQEASAARKRSRRAAAKQQQQVAA